MTQLACEYDAAALNTQTSLQRLIVTSLIVRAPPLEARQKVSEINRYFFVRIGSSSSLFLSRNWSTQFISGGSCCIALSIHLSLRLVTRPHRFLVLPLMRRAAVCGSLSANMWSSVLLSSHVVTAWLDTLNEARLFSLRSPCCYRANPLFSPSTIPQRPRTTIRGWCMRLWHLILNWVSLAQLFVYPTTATLHSHRNVRYGEIPFRKQCLPPLNCGMRRSER